MSKVNESSSQKQNWRSLTREGQTAFWDRQAPDYESADMTLDNESELTLVAYLCKQYCDTGYHAHDIVTLGGAVGCRDPKVVVETARQYGQNPSLIYFNDLSEQMTHRAVADTVATYIEREKTNILPLPGAIHEVCASVPHSPRRVIMGVYRIEALVKANPHYGYALAGIEEYLKNPDKIGTQLTVEPVSIGKGIDDLLAEPISFTVGDSYQQRADFIVGVSKLSCMNDVGAIRIIGRDSDKPGFFLSHWFSEQGIRNLISRSFDLKKIREFSLMPCAKGFVLCIDPLEKPTGIVTILNNVIGNILPEEQVPTLKMISQISQ